MSLSEEKFNELSCFTEVKETLPISQEIKEESNDQGKYHYGARGR
jgi:hypothetical protein